MQKATLDFLKKLKRNNNRDWFGDHRAEYDAALADLHETVDQIIVATARFDSSIKKSLKAKDCVFRIYRDVRFSKEKSPYKPHFGALIGPEGRKGMLRAGYYFHVEPGGRSMLGDVLARFAVAAGGGLHQPPGPTIQKIREAISRNGQAMRKIIEEKKFRDTFGELDGESLKSAPRGFSADHPEIELLRLKSFTAIQKVPDEVMLDPKLPDRAATVFRVLFPLNVFLDRAVLAK